MIAGTPGGTHRTLFQWNDGWNASRRKPAPMLAFQRNDPWNEGRIFVPERSTTPPGGGTAERLERLKDPR